jgi:flagellar protein FlaG
MEISAIGTGVVPSTDRQFDMPTQRFPLESFETARADSRENQVSSDVLKDLEKISLINNRKLRFSFDTDFGDVVVKVVDGDTDKVIREIPPKELQNLHIRLREAIGVLFDNKA